MSRFALHIAVPLALFCLLPVGCTSYEYDLARPTEFAGHIGTKMDQVVARDPLEFRLIAFSDHLIMRIFNTSEDSIELLGPQSSVVDPQGQSHPLRGQSIAPHSFIKLILPPTRPHIERTGPSIGLGFGFIAGANRHRQLGDSFIDDDYAQPRYFDIVDDNALYWDWDGQTEVRMTLAFQRGEQRFTQDFTFRRVKM